MAEPLTANQSFLQGKWGPLPVWAWGAIGLVAAYMYNKYKANQAAQQAQTQNQNQSASSETQAVAPEFVIENNMPAEAEGPEAPTSAGPPVPPSTPVKVPIGHPPIPGGPPIAVHPKPPTGHPKTKAPIEYRVPAGSGQSFSSIAKKFGYKAGGEALYQYNITSSPHSAAAKQEMKSRGPNKLFGNELIYIPQS